MSMTRAELQRMPERQWLKTDVDVRIIGFCPFRDYSGGYLVYAIRAEKYKQFLGNATARKLGLNIINVYGCAGEKPINTNASKSADDHLRDIFPTSDDLRREIAGAIMAAPMLRKIFRHSTL